METELNEINANGETVNTLELYDLVVLNAALCGTSSGEGPILELAEELPPARVRELADSIRVQLESDVDSHKAFVVSEFMPDGSAEQQQVFFADLINELHELAGFLSAAADTGHRLKPSFEF